MNRQLIIIIVYFALTMVIGILASLKIKSSDSFVGSGMGVFAIVCVACGQWPGGTAATGCSEYGFNAGISGWWYTIANGIGMLMMGLGGRQDRPRSFPPVHWQLRHQRGLSGCCTGLHQLSVVQQAVPPDRN